MSIIGERLRNAQNGCFVRCVGGNQSYIDDITELDRQYGGNDYLRVNKLELPQDSDELEQLRQEAPRFCNSFEGARVLALYRSSVTSLNRSIENNLMISLLHWSKLLSDNAGILVYCGRTGYKEYLFCYLAYLKGWRVIMLMPVGEGKLSEQLTDKSERLELGIEQPTDIPPYVPPVRREPEPPQRSPITGNIRVSIPPREMYKRPKNGQSADGRVRVHIPPRPDRRSSIKLPATRQSYSAPTGKGISYDDASRLTGSVVIVETLEYPGVRSVRGSGIAINKFGYILTSFRLVRESMQIQVRTEHDDRTYYARVVKYHTEHDLAVLQIDRMLEPLPVYRGAQGLSKGQKLFFIGSSGGRLNTVSEGMITDLPSFYNAEAIRFSANVFAGSTGGALINTDGELIGICYGSAYGLHSVDLAVSCRVIEPFVRGFL